MSKDSSRVLHYALMNAAHIVVKTMQLSRLIMIPREPKAGLIIMPLGIVPVNLSESSG
ncbi:hypothetical protein SAMN02745158_02425 [Lactonifactor longoviformis DSM 17459]|uniref:Uncharacterized protein n=1 Tax=Lactonifactor longoviformis DSM 17459 TaxID=1122155 RepID=A0A1M4YP85_9CLOT|nr:hypothetical protein SAMN02745158_02425 [Lactonifactor longoviformis DSM 17459]